MKKILDSNQFAIALIVVWVLIGICIAMNDNSHTLALYCIIVGMLLLSTILMIVALVVKSTKRWLYIGLMIFWFLPTSRILIENLIIAEEVTPEYIDVIETEVRMREYEQSEMNADSIYSDSISN